MMKLLTSCAVLAFCSSLFLFPETAASRTLIPFKPAAAPAPAPAPSPVVCSASDVAEIDKLAGGVEANQASDSPFTVAHGLVTFTLTRYVSVDHAVLDGNFFQRTSTDPQTRAVMAGQSFTFVRCNRVMTARVAKIWVVKKGEQENPDTDHAEIQIFFSGR